MARSVTGLTQFKANVRTLQKNVHKTVKDTMQDCMNDLSRVSSETTPIEDGNLEQAWNVLVEQPNKNLTKGFVGYQVWADQPRSYDFDYAIWIHEETYNLGPLSRVKASSGGGQGLSGDSYPVGNKYLERPFYGEAETYRGIFEDNIKQTIG